MSRLPTLSDTPVIANPVQHVEAQSGRYIAMYEGLLDYVMEKGMIELGRSMVLDLIKMTKVGRPKADLTLDRGEIDLSHLDQEHLDRLVAGPVQSAGRANAEIGEKLLITDPTARTAARLSVVLGKEMPEYDDDE